MPARICAILLSIFAAAILAGCNAGPRPNAALSMGGQSYNALPIGGPALSLPDQIRKGDGLTITVFREPDLSQENAFVGGNGAVQMALLGPVAAEGLSAAQFAQKLEGLYASYLTRPSVIVTITKPSARQVTVTGAVTNPGMYEVPSRISLIDAVALAQGPTKIAKYSQVVVFRRLNQGQNVAGEEKRIGAVFDMGMIQSGNAPDIEILPGDQLIVGTHGLKQVYRDLLTAGPLLSLFRPY